MDDVAVVVDARMYGSEQMVLDLLDVFAREGRAVGPAVVREILRDRIDVAVVGAEPVVGILGPIEGRGVIPGADYTARECRFVVGPVG
ncbi:hypothetical protein [Nocardia cyriacigeorgica]|uniref:hypothetical protein n=1 Tax=Nocardia cyriacigeorgica TaxID=135487 RepID=UPI00189513CB|nr:hypothetical protein [Nocardia cyriacigeorgica]MBF6415097.1 hypothetical protein [Nocardia cyriacigeorgica]